MKKLLLIVPSLLIVFLFSGCSQNLAKSNENLKSQVYNSNVNFPSNQNNNVKTAKGGNTTSSMTNIDNSLDKLNNELTNSSNDTESLINSLN